MKTILEFNLPDDHAEMRYAINGKHAIQALHRVADYLKTRGERGGTPDAALAIIREAVTRTLRECGEA